MLPVTASDEDIRQRYLKLANMIHPDKCSHPLARQAFEYVMNASEMLKVRMMIGILFIGSSKERRMY